MNRDQIVFGVEDKKVRKRLLRETELALEVAAKICRVSELSQKQVKSFSEMATAQVSDNTAAVGAVSCHQRRRCRPGRQRTEDKLQLTTQA